MRKIIVIAHNMRSTHNVGSLLRTAEGLGIEKVYFTGYTPYPVQEHDERLPHIAQKLTNQIHKTALGAEQSQAWQTGDINAVLDSLQADGYSVYGLEQAADAVRLPDLAPTEKIVIVLGREVEGLEPEVMERCDKLIEIPMFGTKESFNVVQAAAMTLYHCRFS